MGAICRKNGFVKSYYVLLCAALGFQLGSSIWFIVNFLRSRNRSYNDCILGSTEPNRIGYCQSIENFKKMHPAGMVAVIGIPVLLQLCACSPWLLFTTNQMCQMLATSCTTTPSVCKTRSLPRPASPSQSLLISPFTMSTIIRWHPPTTRNPPDTTDTTQKPLKRPKRPLLDDTWTIL